MIRIDISTINLDVRHRHQLPFYLALEEWVAKRLPDGDYFFTWIVEPTVIYGRNQDPTVEVDLDYCREHGIETYRRHSGGGCVYADRGNMMLSYITPSTDVQTTFAGYTSRVAQMLRSLGLNAEPTGRNDVSVDGQKVSGNAFYHLPGRSIVHGTLLHSPNMEYMTHAITPSRAKLAQHGVTSVEARITTLSPRLPGVSIEQLEQRVLDWFTDGVYTLTEEEAREVDEITEGYYDPHFRWGKKTSGDRRGEDAPPPSRSPHSPDRPPEDRQGEDAPPPSRSPHSPDRPPIE